MVRRLGLSTLVLVVAAWPAAAQVPSEDELWGLRMERLSERVDASEPRTESTSRRSAAPAFLANPGLAVIRLPQAISRGIDGSGSVIAVIDSGFDLAHPVFAGKILEALDTASGNTLPVAPAAHGTHVAGIATGVAPGAQLVLYTQTLNPAANAAAFRAGAAQRAVAFNNSWGYDTAVGAVLGHNAYANDRFQALAEATELFPGSGPVGTAADWRTFVDALREAQRTGVIVFAASNDPSLPDIDVSAGLPLVLPELRDAWIAVVNVDANGDVISVTCGSAARFCMSAPGTDVVSSLPGGGFGAMTGTSMAAPHVSGAVALARELFPNATPEQLTQLVLQTSRDAGAPGVDSVYGWGILDIGNIVGSRDERGARAFASASFSRDAALGHAGTLLRGQLDRRVEARGDPWGPGLEQYASFAASMDGGRIGIADPALRAIWVAPLYGEARLDGVGGAPGTSARTAGLMAGADLVAEERLRLGLAAGWSRTQTTIPGSADTGETDALHVGAYGALEADGWFLKGSAQVAFFSAPPGSGSVTRRDIPGAAGTSGAPVGRTNIEGTGAEIDGRIGYAFEIADGASLAPYVAVRSRWQQTGAARETDAGIFALDVAAASRHQTEIGPGLRLVSGPLVFRDVTLRLSGDIAYARLTGDAAHRSRVVLLGTAMEARTADVGRDILRVGGRLDIARTDGRLTSFVGYDAAFQARAVSHTVSGGLAGSF